MRFAERPPLHRIRIGGAFGYLKRAYSGEYLGLVSDSLGFFSIRCAGGAGYVCCSCGKLVEYLVFEFVS